MELNPLSRPQAQVGMRPPEPDPYPLRVDVINGWSPIGVGRPTSDVEMQGLCSVEFRYTIARCTVFGGYPTPSPAKIQWRSADCKSGKWNCVRCAPHPIFCSSRRAPKPAM